MLNNGLKIQRELKILKMEKLQMKNTWFYKLKFLSLALCLTFFQYAISQQNTFKYVQNGYILSDILEDEKNGYLWCRWDDFWSVFSEQFGWNYQETSEFISHQVEGHFKWKGLTPQYFYSKCFFRWKNISNGRV